MFIRKRTKHTYLILLIGFLFVTNYLKSQNWPKVYGDNFHSLMKDLSESYDKGFVLTAFTYDYSGIPEYGWIIKTDINGNILWDKKFGDGNDRNWLSDSYLTTDHGIIISGITTKYSTGDNDPLFIKTDVCGEIEWCRVLLSPDQNYGSDILQIADGSYIGMLQYYGEGDAYSRISLVKMDQTGEPLWIQQLAQDDSLIYNEEGNYLYMTSDSNYLVSGDCFYPGMRPFWIKADTSGNQLWDLMWQGGVGGVSQVVETQSGYYYCSGGFSGPGFTMTPSIFKFDNAGNPIYHAYLLGDTLIGGGAVPISLLNDSILITGLNWRTSLNVDDGYSEILIIDTLGQIIKMRVLLHENHAPKSLCLSNDKKILVAGNYVTDGNWDIYLWKMNSELEDDSIYTQPITYDSLCPYQILSDTVDLDCSLFVNIDEIPTKEEYESTIKVSPNPARDWIMISLPENVSSEVIELTIYNIYGKEVLKRQVFPQNRSLSFNISHLSSGFYLATCKDAKKQILKGKFVVVR